MTKVMVVNCGEVCFALRPDPEDASFAVGAEMWPNRDGEIYRFDVTALLELEKAGDIEIRRVDENGDIEWQ